MENDNINHPKHYQNGLTVEVECIMFSRHLGFALGNAFKYVWRAGIKDDIKQDIQKALWYLDDATAWNININKAEFIEFLPKYDNLGWKYNILRYILQGGYRNGSVITVFQTETVEHRLIMTASVDRVRMGGNTSDTPSQVSDGICATSAIIYGMGCRLPLINATIAF